VSETVTKSINVHGGEEACPLMVGTPEADE
jgi:hypothetical protein